MAKFTLRPFFRRLSSKHSATNDSTTSDASDTTQATSALPSPSPPAPRSASAAPHARHPRKSSSLARLREKFRGQQEADIPELPPSAPELRSNSHPSSLEVHRNKDNAIGAAPEALAYCSEKLAEQPPATPTTSTTSSSSTQGAATASRTLHSSGVAHAPHEPASPSSSQAPSELKLDIDNIPSPRLVVEEPTPEALSRGTRSADRFDKHTPSTTSSPDEPASPLSDHNSYGTRKRACANQPGLIVASSLRNSAGSHRLSPDADTRRQSLVAKSDAPIVTTLIDAPARDEQPRTSTSNSTALPTGVRDYFTDSVPNMAAMLQRKIWVRRPGQSATLVQIREEDLVDDVRDMILRKYANSLGKTFDSPDMTLRIVARGDPSAPRHERILGPDEEMGRTIDAYFPGGQTVDEALIIDVPQRRTPRPSPRPYPHQGYHALDDFRPAENGTDYFPPMPATIQPTLPHTALPGGREHHSSIAAADHPRSISVLNTGQVPPLPSPGGGRTRGHRAEREHRPKYGRQHTSSPTIISHNSVPAHMAGASASAIPPSHLAHRSSNRPRVDSSASEHPSHQGLIPNGVPPPPPAPSLPSPPAPEAAPTARTGSTPPTPQAGAQIKRPRKGRKSTPDKPASKTRSPPPQADPYGTNPALPNISNILDGSVPPINVLIVEDNIINLRILEGLMKRLKVRWQTAMNGQIAVDKWKGGGYHLVLMDIQMPVMNGLQATKEIRRLERVNGIGVFSSSTPGSPNEGASGTVANGTNGEVKHNPDDDKLPKAEGLFKSPVIIVALTASSLQSDRHEALAAGCNDFLTKPVNFVWLERKVKEWGCMQALIDFDGWRRWKDYAIKEEEGKSEEQKQKEREQEEKQRIKSEKLAKLQEKQRLKREEEQREKERKKRESVDGNRPSEEAVAA